ncbi:hypothetical protein J7M23_04270 [Candidatus Sumerlaeota bacterium]|nr:hypothetical protein [Candidatus Sumerlaeota bacterium]
MDITQEDGTLYASYDQDAFGNILSGSSSGYHLTTKCFYPTIGLYYFYFRWYEPKLGRFLRKSLYPPYEEHPFVYTENNPICYIDSLGVKKKKPSPVQRVLCQLSLNTCTANCITKYGGSRTRGLRKCLWWCGAAFGCCLKGKCSLAFPLYNPYDPGGGRTKQCDCESVPPPGKPGDCQECRDCVNG